MRQNSREEQYSDGEIDDLTLIVKRVGLTFDDKECQVLNFADITAYQRLRREEEKSKLLTSLNT